MFLSPIRENDRHALHTRAVRSAAVGPHSVRGMARQAHGGPVHRCRLSRFLRCGGVDGVGKVSLRQDNVPLFTFACFSSPAKFVPPPVLGKIPLLIRWYVQLIGAIFFLPRVFQLMCLCSIVAWILLSDLMLNSVNVFMLQCFSSS